MVIKIKPIAICIWVIALSVPCALLAETSMQSTVAEKEESAVSIEDEFIPRMAFHLQGEYLITLSDFYRERFADRPVINLGFQYFPKHFQNKKFFQHLTFLGEVSYQYSVFEKLEHALWNTYTGGVGAQYQLPIKHWLYLKGTLSGGYFLNHFTVKEIQPELFHGGYVKAGLGAGFLLADRFDISLNAQYHIFIDEGISTALNHGFSTQLSFGIRFEKPTPRITIQKISIPDLFTALLPYYSEEPIAEIELVNDSGVDLSKVSVDIQVPGFMDGASQSKTIESFPNEKSTAIAMNLILNDNVFQLSDTIHLNAEIRINYQYKEKPLHITGYQRIKLHHKNAMTWDNDEKLASFITPLDPAVNKFSRTVAQETATQKNHYISDTIQDAMAIYTAVSDYGVTYVSDPSSPISGNSTAVDYIQFSRDILKNKTGDCDDLTVLYCTLLENIGIETAFVTVPGHIFMMFNTDISEDKIDTVTHDPSMIRIEDGNIWIPVEVTAIGREQFTTAWRWAAEQLERWRGVDGMNVHKTAFAQSSFPSLALPETSFEPSFTLQPTYFAQLQRQNQTLLSFTNIETLEALLQRLAHEPDNKDLLNQIGEMMLGEAEIAMENNPELRAAAYSGTTPENFQKAIAYFQQALEADPAYIPARLNLVRVYIELKQWDQAKQLIQKGIEIEPTNTQWYTALGLVMQQY